MPEADDTTADIILVGGGLANCLIAVRLKARRPELKVCMFERADARDASHTWSCFDTDLPEDGAWALELAQVRWPGYRVRFLDGERQLTTGYVSISGESLSRAVEAALSVDLHRGSEVVVVYPDRVRLADERVVTAPLVIDGRGATRLEPLVLAWQKFVGLEVRLKQPHGLHTPLVMDATVPQNGGYRFFYVLPLAPDVLLVEDTYYSNGADLDPEAVRHEVEAYAQSRWSVDAVLREEKGVLPIALGGDIERFWAARTDGVPRAGMQAALFHPTTGYSLPDAVKLANALADAPKLTSSAVEPMVRERSIRLWRERAFFRALNRMMFLAARPEQRRAILARFYSLPAPLIERFYAARPTLGDRARILLGKPPVPLGRALKALPPSAAKAVHFA